MVVAIFDPALNFIDLVMVGVHKLNILSSLRSSEVSEEVGVNDGAPNFRGIICASTTLDAIPIRSIWGGIDMNPILCWIIQNVRFSIS